MANLLLSPDYAFDTSKGIWSRPGYAGISYSDGDEAELRIARIIRDASDVTIFSTELREYCTDWPSLYHLSGSRSNILRPFESLLKGDILEIGAGCGAVTRYLGESGANVLALEGSPRRAAITRSRTRDLENVIVLSEKFEQFQCAHRFDVITLIGVLEYASLFTTGERPAIAMLRFAQSLLKPEGKLIVAIENQLGLKYFAGAPEDHLGQPMYGIEGRYKTHQPETFGRAVLADLLKETGFTTIKFLAPFPDYKLAVSILTEAGLSHKKFDGAALAWQSVRRDPQLPSSTNFSLELAWPAVFKNGLALDMSNSFLIAASSSQRQVIKSGILGYHYATDRAAKYCKETVFEHFDDNTLAVDYRLLSDSQDDAGSDDILTFRCPEKTAYTEGTPLSLEFIRIVTRDGWSIEEVATFVRRYINLLSLIADQKGNPVVTSRLTDKLPGNYFDLVPQNIIVCHDGRPVVIDTEWSLNKNVELGWLLFRSLVLAMGSGVSFGKNSKGQPFLRRTFIKSALETAGYPLTDDDYSRFVALECVIQQQVSNRMTSEFLTRWSEEQLPICSMAEHHDQISRLTEQINRLNKLVAERDSLINAIQNSRSWGITRPLRTIARVIRHGQIR